MVVDIYVNFWKFVFFPLRSSTTPRTGILCLLLEIMISPEVHYLRSLEYMFTLWSKQFAKRTVLARKTLTYTCHLWSEWLHILAIILYHSLFNLRVTDTFLVTINYCTCTLTMGAFLLCSYLDSCRHTIVGSCLSYTERLEFW